MKYSDYISNYYAEKELQLIRSNNNPSLINEVKEEKEINTEALKVYCLVLALLVITLMNI